MRELAQRLDIPAATAGGYVTARHLPSTSQLPVFTALLRVCGVAEADLAGWLQALGRVRNSSDRRTRRAASPYPGLASFQEQDAASFFGRADAVRLLLQALRARTARPGLDNPLLAVVGASGSGKSSLLRAGLIPAVRDGALNPDGRPAGAALITPAPDPAAALHGALQQRPRLIVIDQFEELFTACTGARRREFLDRVLLLDPAITAVVVGLRADFYSDAVREPALVPALQHGQLVVPAMTADELRAAIVEPARRLGVNVDSGLVDLLLYELGPGRAAGAGSGTLPLLSHALLATWSRARGSRLTIEDYLATGGIDGAIQQSAEEAYLDLEPASQELARKLFVRLVNLDDALIARRRAERVELEALGDPRDPDAASISAVIGRFVERRLLTVDRDSVEVSHEALLTAWPRLRDWVAADRDGLRLLRELTRAANIWAEQQRDESVLLRGGRLEVMRALAGDPQRGAELNALERDFVAASSAAAARELGAARRHARRLQRLLAVVAVLAVVVSGLAVYATYSGISARNQRAAANQARDQALSRQVAIEARQLRDTDPALATQLALAAYRISPTTDARSVLLDASADRSVTRLLGPPGPTTLAQRPDGRVIAVSHADDGSVHLYRTRGDEPPQPLGVIPGSTAKARQLFALRFSPDGQVLATGGEGRTVQLWNVTDPAEPHPMATLSPALGTAVQAIGFSPDGRTLVAVGGGPAALRWDLGDPARPRALGPLPGAGSLTAAQAVAFAPDGRALAVGGTDGQVLIWTNRTERPAARLTAGTGTITSLAFAPDDRQLAAGGKDGNLHLWDVTDPARPRRQAAPTTGFTTWLNVLAYSPDGRALAAGSSDRDVKVWDTDGWTLTDTVPQPGPVTGLDFSSDGTRILTTAADGSLHSWPTAPRALPVNGSVFTLGYTDAGRLNVTTTGPNGSATLWNTTSARPTRAGTVAPSGAERMRGASALSRDGSLLASGTKGGAVLLWDVRDPAKPARLGPDLHGATDLVESLALTPDAGLLAAGADDNAVHLWDVRDRLHPRTLPKLATDSIVLGVGFNPDGTLLAAAVADNTARLYDVRDPSKPRLVATLTGFKSYAWAVGFSPDGRILAVSSADHTTRLWDVTDPARPRQLGAPITGPRGYATGVSFTPDGRTLAISGEDQTVWLYDISDPAHPITLATLRSLTSSVYAVAFAPDGRTLAAAGGDPVVRMWDVDTGNVARSICRTAGDPITRQEWADYVPGAPYQPPCS